MIWRYTLTDKQSDLNEEMNSKGKNRLLKQYNKAKERELLTTSKTGNILLRRVIDSTLILLEDWIKNTDNSPAHYASVRSIILSVAPNKAKKLQLCVEVCRYIVDSIIDTQIFVKLARAIGNIVENKYIIDKYKKLDYASYQSIVRGLKKESTDKKRRKISAYVKEREPNLTNYKFSPESAVRIGGLFIMMLEQAGFIKCSLLMKSKNRMVRIVDGTDETMQFLAQTQSKLEERFPFYMPSLSVPKEWNNLFDGGYKDNVINKTLVKTRRPELRTELNKKRMPEFYKAVNSLQKVGYRINSNVLETASHFWKTGVNLDPFGDTKDTPIPPFPKEAETDKELKVKWKREVGRIRLNNTRNAQKRVLINQIINLASKFSDDDFYFPMVSDFRGRLYTVPQYITFQGNDLSRALIEFADSKLIKTEQDSLWLKLHVANVWDQDKLTIEERLSWLDKNKQLLIRVSEDPINNNEWMKLDKPFQGLAAAFEIHGYFEALKSGTEFYTRLPVWIDGSNNGLQIFSLLVKDEVGAKATNVYPNDVPDDIYARVAEATIEQLNSKDNEKARYWLEFGIDRKATKKVVMTVPYGVSSHSARHYIREWYEDKCKAKGITPLTPALTFSYSSYLTNIVLGAIKKIARGSIETMAWLKECAKLISHEGKGLRWTSPSGFFCIQEDLKSMSNRVVLTYGEKYYHAGVADGYDGVSLRKQTSGISPNFIHSLDAAILHLLVNRCAERKIHAIATIHDSFAALSPDMPLVINTLLSVIKDTFSYDLLKKLKTELEHNSGVKLPDPPIKGDLDVSLIVNSKYMFS